MKNKRAIEGYKFRPKMQNIYDVDLTQEKRKIYCTENIIGANIDIILDQPNDYIGIRVDEAASGPLYKIWSKFIRNKFDLDFIKRSCPIPVGGISMVGVLDERDAPVFAMVLSAYTYNPENGKALFIKWDWLDNLCKTIGLQRFPQVYSGVAKPEILKQIDLKSFMGYPKNGLIMITDDPVKYISFRGDKLANLKSNIVPSDKPQEKKNDMGMAVSLVTEFVKIVADPVEIKKRKHLNNSEAVFQDILENSKESRLLDNYIERCVSEAEIDRVDAFNLIKMLLRREVDKIFIGDMGTVIR